MIVHISGGCKNGKTSIAEKLIDHMSCGKDMYYVATMVPYDTEDIKRIDRHIKERAKYHFETIEIVDDIDKIKDKSGYFIFDSLTAYLLNHIIDRIDKIDDDNQKTNVKSDIDYSSDKIYQKIKRDIDTIVDIDKNIVFVSDYIYSDASTYSDFVKYYMKTLSMIDRYVASISDSVIEVSNGDIIYHKGREKIERYL